MIWCKCPNCSHKLFLLVDKKDTDNVFINVKCSSCKKLIDVVVKDGVVNCYENKTR